MPRIRHEFARPPQPQAAPIRPLLDARQDAPSRLRQRLAFAIGPTLIVAMGATVVASAQSNSPFASKKETQAWETPAAAQPIPATPVRAPAAGPSSIRPAETQGGLAGPAPSLRLRAAPRDQSDAMTARLAPVRPSAPPESAASKAASAPVRSEEKPAPPAAAPAPAPVRATISASAAPTALTPGVTAPQSAPVTRHAPAVPSRWTLGSSHRAGIQGASTYGATNQTWSAGTQTYGAVPSSPQESIATRQAGQYGSSQYGQARRLAADTDPSDFEPEPDLPMAWYPPGTGPRTAGASTAQAQVRSQQASPYAAPQGQPAWERQPSTSQPQSGPFTPGPNARGPYAQTPPSEGPYSQGPYSQEPYSPGPNSQGPYNQDPYNQDPGNQGPYGQGPYSGPMDQQQPQRRGWMNRMGLGALTTFIRGGLRLGAGARENNGWEETFIADADVEAEVSAVTQGGIEWGVHTQVRGQYDKGRKGFTRRLPDCPPTLIGCPSVIVAGNQVAVRGHTSQFYTFGPDVSKDTQIALESAHLFARSAYGDVTIGRDDGAAYLFSLGAPTLLNVGASNSGVDYTGLDAVRTRNEASGFSEKITYTSPRLLGDQVGVGIQIGGSYAPNASACGVDYCVDLNDIDNVAAPDIKDVLEAGIALDRTFANGLSVEGTLTYARGSEQSALAEMDDLQTFGAGVEVKLSDWTLGGSFLQSNQGLMNGDYQAYDIGLTWQPSQLGFTLGYGHATDDLVGLQSDQFVGGVTFDLNERVRLGAGVQYADRDTVRNVAGTAQIGNEKATAIFIEGGLKF